MKNIRFSKIHRGLFFWTPRTCRKPKREVLKVILIFEDFRQLSIFVYYRIQLKILGAGNPYYRGGGQWEHWIHKMFPFRQVAIFTSIICRLEFFTCCKSTFFVLLFAFDSVFSFLDRSICQVGFHVLVFVFWDFSCFGCFWKISL